MKVRTNALAVLLAATVLPACGAAGSPAAAFDGVRAAARARDLAALYECLAASERERMDREIPGWNAERGDGPALARAAHARELDSLAARVCVGFAREGGRALLHLLPPAPRGGDLPMVEEGGHWRVADLGAVLGLAPERRAALADLVRAGDALRRRRDEGRLPDAAGTAFLVALGLPEETAAAYRGPSRDVLARVAAGEGGLPLAADGAGADGRSPRLPDGLPLLWADGTAEFLPWRDFPGAPEGPVPVGPDSPIPLLRGLVYTE